MMRMNQAIAAALADEMAADETVVVFGEDVAAAGGPFKTSEGLLERFGRARVRDTPISEMAFTGAAVGAAMLGLRPVVEIMFMEFLGVALDQLVTEGAMMRYLSAGHYGVPLVLRASVGAGTGFGGQHSGTHEGWLMGSPGLVVVTPSDAASAYALTRLAIRHPDPVVVLEPRALYGQRGPVERGSYGELALGRARILRPGTGASLVASGRMVGIALAAAAELSSQEGIEIDVIDLLTISPWDREAVVESVRRTGRLVVVDESTPAGGWSPHVVATVAELCHGDLAAPPISITAPPVPVPFGAELERWHSPCQEEIIRRVRHLVVHDEALPPWWASRNGSELHA